jgi:hypothetical protein
MAIVPALVRGVQAATGGGGLLGLGLFKGLGKVNRSQAEDCYGQVNELGLTPEQAIAAYPQCAPYLGGGGMVPRVLPGAGAVSPTYGNQIPISFQPPAQMSAVPLMGMVPPMMGGMARLAPLMGGAWTTGGTMRMLGAVGRNALPVLNNAIAIASGYMLVKGIWYTPDGMAVGRRRRRRRVNPLNYRAAMRAARRLGLVQELVGRINKALPTAGKQVRIKKKRRS